MGTPIYDKMMADKAKKSKSKSTGTRVKTADVAESSKSSGVEKMTKNSKPNKTATQKIRRGTK